MAHLGELVADLVDLERREVTQPVVEARDGRHEEAEHRGTSDLFLFHPSACVIRCPNRKVGDEACGAVHYTWRGPT